jgi:metallo-beta-lactamase family protein
VNDKASITFYGGAGTVTGANFLFDIGDKKILVDCGALEREYTCDPANSMSFDYDPKDIDVLIITHAHADHIGRVPKLVQDGFKGIIYSTAATRDLAALMFDDALTVMRADSEKHGCTVWYEKEDVAHALSLWQTHEYHESFKVGSAEVEFLDAGHILGSAMIRFTRGGRRVMFTGDLGNSPEPLLNDTESPEGVNYLVMESVYGDRMHEDRDERDAVLRGSIEAARARGGTLLIPSFSIERTQILLYEMEQMIEKGMKPIPVYLDAPLAIRVTEVYRTYANLLNPAARAHFEDGKDAFTFKNLHIIKDVAESRDIHKASDPKVIIAGAGMSVGGRIRSHETRYLPDPKAAVLFVGYQAPGSLGRRIADGQKKITIDGVTVQVKATIGMLTGYSGHKDRDGLLSFVEQVGASLQKVFVVMGEPKSELFLSQRINDFLGVEAHVPAAGETAVIEW